ncbi:GAF domain-containing protein [Brevibacterium sp. RIT 803]|uniref:helix-turn-helix domain-containing protein n=1 Tax=Brevibacterium sp. RIT 803 TaxID=2810210 RepID=UPI001950FDA8|nr:GAF domain-containing protein [Brevibacterium sp. RIT 803]MBM6590784.1 GAF domain-containing protein [Brevibacterium sp. RIT 803]
MDHHGPVGASQLNDEVSADTVLALLRATSADHTAAIEEIDSRIRAEGLDPRTAQRIIAEARQLQNTHSHLHRRSQELAGLLSSARELVALHDVDTVLQRLVQRAHDLIGTDVTYLSEIEAGTGGMRVRHSVGTVSELFRDLVVPMGKGLASKVVEARAPVWVSRYEEMIEAPRDPGIDAAVEAEGLSSFLGVPMIVGNEILGALFACNRFGHDFTPEQVALLSAFADHATVALNSARLLRNSHQAAEAAETAYRELADHVAQMERANQVHETLTAAVVAGGSIGEIVTTMSRALAHPVIALDARLRRLTADPIDVVSVPAAHKLAAAVAESRETGHCAEATIDDTHWITIAIVGADSLTGALIMQAESGSHSAVEYRLLERAAHVAALLSLKRDAVDTARAERRSRILRDLLDGTELERADPTSELLTLSGQIRWASALSIPDGDTVRPTRRIAQLVGDEAIFTLRGNQLIVLWAIADGPEHTERLRRQLAAEMPSAITAVFAPIHDESLVASAERSARCLEILPSLGIAGLSVPAESFVPYQALASTDPDAAVQFIAQMLDPIIAWDERRGTELIATLGAYFDAGESGSGAGRMLHVHKNTIHQRLERIHELTDGALADPEYRFRVNAAVRLLRLRGELLESALAQKPR